MLFLYRGLSAVGRCLVCLRHLPDVVLWLPPSLFSSLYTASTMRRPTLLLPALLATYASAQVTVYKPVQQVIFNGVSSAASSSVTAAAASYTGAAAYNTTQLQPPAVPNPPINTTIDIALTSGALPVMSLAQNGGFFGFSIEMSVVNQMCKYI